jgi:hypothetical protein
MKKLILILTFVLIPQVFFGQQSVFDKFDGMDDVTSVLVTKKMFQMMGNVKMDANDKETQQFITLTKKLNNLKVFTTSNPKIKVDLKSVADKYIVSAGLDEFQYFKKQ